MSTDKGFRGWGTPETPGDEKLLRHLWTSEPKHTTPFEMAGMVIEVQAPIMVFREWHRHRTFSYNEMSARYTVLPELSYVPSVERLMAAKQSTTNKQGSEAGLDEATAKMAQTILTRANAISQFQYESLLDLGCSREIARLPVNVAQYSRMRAQAVLLNWLKFLTLRNHPKAQWEIQQYAQAVEAMIALCFPRTHGLFRESA